MNHSKFSKHVRALYAQETFKAEMKSVSVPPNILLQIKLTNHTGRQHVNVHTWVCMHMVSQVQYTDGNNMYVRMYI